MVLCSHFLDLSFASCIVITFEKDERASHIIKNASFFFFPRTPHKRSQNTHACKASSRNNNNGRRRRSDRLVIVAFVVEVLQRRTTTSKLFFVEVRARERDGTSDERVRNILREERNSKRRRSGRTRGRRKKARR